MVRSLAVEDILFLDFTTHIKRLTNNLKVSIKTIVKSMKELIVNYLAYTPLLLLKQTLKWTWDEAVTVLLLRLWTESSFKSVKINRVTDLHWWQQVRGLLFDLFWMSSHCGLLLPKANASIVMACCGLFPCYFMTG